MNEFDDVVIDIQKLSFSRGDRSIYDEVDIKIPRGKITGIMGPSGTGKTTLLRLIGGQLKPDAGSILVDDENIPELNRSDLFSVRERMGMLFQSGALFTDISVFENVAFPIRVHTDLSDDMIRDVVLMKLQAVGLRGAHNLMPSEHLVVWPVELRWLELLHSILILLCMMSLLLVRILSQWVSWLILFAV